jgi:glyceraldehyde-3-phosphate dehydrogenase/erythrose-4-phosphate dehydrogenase
MEGLDKMTGAALAVVTAIVGLAIVAVIVSKNAQAPQVLQAAGTALSGMISAAVAPVTQSNQLGTGSFGN